MFRTHYWQRTPCICRWSKSFPQPPHTHIAPLPYFTRFYFIQTHEFFYCASCHLPILNQRIFHPQEHAMYHESCFHLAALPPDILGVKAQPPGSAKVIFLSPSRHPNAEVLTVQLPTTTSILEVVQFYSTHLHLHHTAITVNGIPARTHIANGSTLNQLPQVVVIFHCIKRLVPLPWPRPPHTVQVVCLPHYSVTFCGRPRVFHLCSNTPIQELATQFASHAWCDPTTNLHIFWLTIFGSISTVEDVPGHLTLSDFGPQVVLFELDSTIYFPSPRLQKILRHSYLEYAPVYRTLMQHFDSLPSNLKISLYDSGPITCTQHTATFCLQNNHKRKAHLRQLAFKCYNNFTFSEDNIG